MRNRYVFTADLLLITLSVLVSFSLRLELDSLFPTYWPAIIWMTGVALAVKPAVYYWFGLYRRLWAYASVNELKTITIAVSLASAAVAPIMIALFAAGVFVGLPRSVLGIDWLLSLVLIGGFRFLFRILAEPDGSALAKRPSGGAAGGGVRRVLVIGAGDAGALVVREMLKNPQMSLQPVGFLDDDPAKQRHQIHGIPVIGTLGDLGRVLDDRPVDEVVIAIPSAPGSVVRRVTDACRAKSMPFRTMPGIYELIGGTVSVNRLREVDIADLLRREPAQIQNELVRAALLGKRVLVTGAGGSIGREICRQIARWAPAELVLLGHGENSIFEAILELHQDFPAVTCLPVIADIRDRARLHGLFARHRPQVVFHAAAHKHVPLMEANVSEAVTNNVLGTRDVVEAAIRAEVERLVMISTDKAVRPVNVMGATKRLAEMLVLDAARRTGAAYSVVRFGNVLGSRGSVVPLFKQQIARGGPVTITHPDMRRFFMIIPEAVHLVLQAAAMGQGGEVFLLNMGQQVRILDLAEDLIRLSGLEPGRDIEIVYTGIRPGEKLSEELFEIGTPYERTAHPDVLRVDREEGLTGTALQAAVDKLAALALEAGDEAILDLFDALIPGAAVRSSPSSDVTAVI